MCRPRRELCWTLACVAACGEPGAREEGGPAPASAASGPRSEGDDGVVSMQAAELRPAWALEAGRYVLRSGGLELEVEPGMGGRITRFSLDGENVLTGPEVVAAGQGALPTMYGSTFWTSPQSSWGWPPEAALDVEPHAVLEDGAVLMLESQPGATTGYVVRKRLWAEPARGRVSIEYTLRNERAAAAAAPWEISRVPKDGFAFFPAGAPPLERSTLGARLEGGVSWVDLSRTPGVDSKLFQDGAEGWLAYVLGDLAFIKTFEDLAPGDVAPAEAEIEVFASGLLDYVELEQQGRHSLPPPGAGSSWRVDWLLRRVPAGVDASLGSAALLGWVREAVASSR